MNIHENMLRQIIMNTIKGVKSGIKTGAQKVMGAMGTAPPETLHGPYGMKQGINPPDAPMPKPQNLQGSVGPISRFEKRR